ncbi:sensor histidine kinase [Clostridium magnum]|uniref:histidine kinase n=1 Tax=Clostridium magnum DSM 2767 TaxID=1121326 RepID=A0A162TQR1_9CLOT|nr:HAMP domain-containing sensor histidine kinase [Clostridium magnum]KZL92933.1 sensor histidine kinase YycG [Clostridium magnum DSM 2767]SHJ16894.1 Signal transduction histidine kinase [Clostridium magnum DSM 2767]
MKMSLMKKLSVGFLLAVLGAILIAGFVSNYMVGKKFNNYLVDEHKDKVNKIVVTAQDLYNDKTGFTNSNKDELLRYAVLEELYIQVKDTSGNIIFDSGNSHLQHKNMMESMMGNMMKNGMGHYSNMNIGEYKEETHPLVKDKKNIGTIVVGYFGTSYLSQGALTFKMTLNHSFILSGFIALIFGLGVSFILAKQLTKPLVKITKTANEMRKGNLAVRSEVKSKTKEIEELSASINYLAETLQNQEMLRKRLTSDMAHEIRTPLTTLKTHVEALIDGIWEPTEERLQSFYDEIERLTSLVDNLRNLAKLEQADSKLNKTKFNLSSELEKIILSFEPLYLKNNHTIMSNIDKNIWVYMDKDKLKQIMHNLLSNGYKYLKSQGKVLVELKKEKEGICIKVEDSGIGIPEKDIPYIFERFYRTDLSRNKNTGGSGIGLTITKSLVESHGGKISVESKEEEGSTFIVQFPKRTICEIGEKGE